MALIQLGTEPLLNSWLQLSEKDKKHEPRNIFVLCPAYGANLSLAWSL